jgi:hypothetical protein
MGRCLQQPAHCTASPVMVQHIAHLRHLHVPRDMSLSCRTAYPHKSTSTLGSAVISHPTCHPTTYIQLVTAKQAGSIQHQSSKVRTLNKGTGNGKAYAPALAGSVCRDHAAGSGVPSQAWRHMRAPPAPRRAAARPAAIASCSHFAMRFAAQPRTRQNPATKKRYLQPQGHQSQAHRNESLWLGAQCAAAQVVVG